MRRLFRWALVAIVVAGTGALFLRAVDWRQLVDGLARISPAAAAVIAAFQGTLICLATASWVPLLTAAGRRAGFLSALRADLAGFTVTWILPSVTLGGIPVRAGLIAEAGWRDERVYATIALNVILLNAAKVPAILAGAALLLARRSRALRKLARAFGKFRATLRMAAADRRAARMSLIAAAGAWTRGPAFPRPMAGSHGPGACWTRRPSEALHRGEVFFFGATEGRTARAASYRDRRRSS